MELLLVKQALALIGTGISAITDWKTGYIYDKITYPLIALGILLTILSLNPYFIANTLVMAGLVFVIGYALYYTGQIGGGDVKIFTALTLLLPITVEPGLPAFFMILVVATLINVLGTIAYYGSKYVLYEKKKEVGLSKLIIGIALVLLSIMYTNIILNMQILTTFGVVLVVVPLIAAIFYTVFGDDMNNKTFAKQISMSKVEDGDVLAPNKIDKKIRKILGAKKVLDEAAIKKLKKHKIKKLWIYANAPAFGPSIFIATIITVFYPDWFLLMLLI